MRLRFFRIFALVLLVASALPAQSNRGKGDGDRSPTPIQRSIFDRFVVPVDAPDENPPELGKAAPGPGEEIPIRKVSVQPNSFFYYYVTGLAFRPRESTTTYQYQFNGCVNQTGGTDNRFNAPIPIRDGDTIKFVRIYYIDTSPSDLTVWLTKYEAGVSNTDVTSVSSTGTGGFGTQLSAEVTEEVDKFAHAYTLNFGPGVTTSANQLCGARIAYYPQPPGEFNPVTPCRVFDTRAAGPQTTGAPLASPGPHNFRIQGNCGVPNGARAVALNATILGATQLGDLRLYPAGGASPLVSTLNYPASPPAPIANGAVVPLAPVSVPTDKDLTVAIAMVAAGTVHLLIDVSGYYY